MISINLRTMIRFLGLLLLVPVVNGGSLLCFLRLKRCPKPTRAPTSAPTNAPVRPPTSAPVTPPKKNVTLAALGDWPYSQLLLDNKGRLLNSINNDSSIDAIIHVGDIHSGSMPCSGAGMNVNNATLTTGGLTGLGSVASKFASNANIFLQM